MRTGAGAAVLALCATRAGVKPRVTAQQHNRHTKKDLARKLFDIRHPRKIRLIGTLDFLTCWPSTRKAAIWLRPIAAIVPPISQRLLGSAICQPPKRSEEHTSELQSLRHLVCRL